MRSASTESLIAAAAAIRAARGQPAKGLTKSREERAAFKRLLSFVAENPALGIEKATLAARHGAVVTLKVPLAKLRDSARSRSGACSTADPPTRSSESDRRPGATLSPPPVRRSPAVLALALLAPSPARAVDWPAGPPSATTDYVAPYRWDRLPAWIAPAPIAPRAALALLDRAPADTPAFHQRRAVLLRLLAREPEALAALDRARALSPAHRLDDPDALLTAAWIDARSGRFDVAVPAALGALAAMPPSPTREGLVLEVVRWSLARGPDGLDDARALLDALASAAPWSPRAVALRVLVLARSGAMDEARALAATARPVLSPGLAEPAGADRQGVAFAELMNAVGVALALNGDADVARPLLQRALDLTPAPWRASQARWISAPAPRSPR